jgi:hypothetical protein
MKLNTDGAIDLSRGIARAGIVVRNNVEELLAAACIRYNYVMLMILFTVELLTCRDAMLVAVQKTDCQGVGWQSFGRINVVVVWCASD